LSRIHAQSAHEKRPCAKIFKYCEAKVSDMKAWIKALPVFAIALVLIIGVSFAVNARKPSVSASANPNNGDANNQYPNYTISINAPGSDADNEQLEVNDQYQENGTCGDQWENLGHHCGNCDENQWENCDDQGEHWGHHWKNSNDHGKNCENQWDNCDDQWEN